jgi:antirestriction protein ArdC
MKGNVRKGEKSAMVVFFKQYETEDRQTHEAKTVPVLRYYRVFNAEQCEGITIPDAVKFEPLDFKPIDAAEQIVQGYEGAPATEHGGIQAYYQPAEDRVQMPEPTRFTSSQEYYSTLLHELSHSTGHSTRLDRKLDTAPKPFGTPDYGRHHGDVSMVRKSLAVILLIAMTGCACRTDNCPPIPYFTFA